MIANIPDKLSLVRGADVDVELWLFSRDGEPEDLGDAVSAVVEFRSSAGETPDVSISGGAVLIEPGGATGVVRASLTAAQVADLELDSYLVRALIDFGSRSFYTSAVYAEVSEA